VNSQFPLPSFEDIRKIFEFWTDQENKWFYFEIGSIRSGSKIISEVRNMNNVIGGVAFNRNDEISIFLQDRIVGKIHDVVTYPPSLLLEDATVFTTKMEYDKQNTNTLVSTEKRNRYGLVFSQITYYEPVNDIISFLSNDKRINLKIG
jgi:hypothetical protein